MSQIFSKLNFFQYPTLFDDCHINLETCFCKMRAVISPNISLPQVYRLLFVKSLSGHLDVVQLDEARRTSARADRALYTRARASALLYRSWRGARAAELYGN